MCNVANKSLHGLAFASSQPKFAPYTPITPTSFQFLEHTKFSHVLTTSHITFPWLLPFLKALSYAWSLKGTSLKNFPDSPELTHHHTHYFFITVLITIYNYVMIYVLTSLAPITL